jgi:hypothetical protein
MQTEIDDSRLLMLWTAVIAITLFCATVISAVEGWAPNALGHTGNGPAKSAWGRTNTIQPYAAQARPAFFTVPADRNEANETPKTTKG